MCLPALWKPSENMPCFMKVWELSETCQSLRRFFLALLKTVIPLSLLCFIELFKRHWLPKLWWHVLCWARLSQCTFRLRCCSASPAGVDVSDLLIFKTGSLLDHSVAVLCICNLLVGEEATELPARVCTLRAEMGWLWSNHRDLWQITTSRQLSGGTDFLLHPRNVGWKGPTTSAGL